MNYFISWLEFLLYYLSVKKVLS